ncbi:MAG: hypothetical protein K8U57_19415 [Planctomycetes bacterium]|nr:hypothetical protein [Planctomycetota bacterium]
MSRRLADSVVTLACRGPTTNRLPKRVIAVWARSQALTEGLESKKSEAVNAK